MPIDIDWNEVLCHRGPDEPVEFEDTPSPATPARARAARGKREADPPVPRRYNTRFGGLVRDGGAGERGRRAGNDAARKAVGDVRCGTGSATSVFEFNEEDEKGESQSEKYRIKRSPVKSRYTNYGKLGTNGGRSVKHFGGGERKPIPVDKMYSSQPYSTTLTGHQQRVHAIDPEDSDHERCLLSQSRCISNFTKRRKEQHQDSSSLYTRKVQDVVNLDNEDMQPEEIVDCGTPEKQTEPKIHYPSIDDPEAVVLFSSDIQCLEPGVYLSSPVINYYIQYIKRTKLLKEEKFYIFNTYFYSKLEEALVRTSDFMKLRRWWKGINIFDRAYIILPIHGMAHWSLIIICIPGKESNSGPIIIHLDSLGMHSSTKIFDTVKRYLEEEWRHLKKNPPPDTSISESIWEDLPRNIHTQIVQVPQQNNAYDCGIFMLYYIERFVREAPERFTRDKLGMFSRSWFNSEDASELRLRIQALLLEEFESARLDDDAISDAGCTSDGDEGKSDLGIEEVPESDEVPTGSTRHDVRTIVDCVLSEAATFSDGIKDESPVKAYSDSSKAEEEEFAIVSPDRLENYEGSITSKPYADVVVPDTDSDDDMVVEVPKRTGNRLNCLII